MAFPLLLGDNAASTVLAKWLFIPPTPAAIQSVSAYLIEYLGDQWPEGLAPPPLLNDGGKVQRRGEPKLSGTLSLEHMTEIADRFSSLDVIILDQMAGDIVHVLPGYMHAVYNMQPCIKLAYDFLTSEDVLSTAVSMVNIASGVFGQRMADDYSDVGSQMAEFLDQAYASAHNEVAPLH